VCATSLSWIDSARVRRVPRLVVLAAATIDILFKILLTPAYLSATTASPSAGEVVVSMARCGLAALAAWLGVLLWLLRPMTAWLEADARGEGAGLVAKAGHRIYRLPLMLALVWSAEWTAYAWVQVGDLGPYRWSTFLCLLGTCVPGPAPIGYMVMRRLLWSAMTHVSEQARAQGLRLSTPPLSLRMQMLLFAFCVALAPSFYMGEVAFSAGAGNLTFRELVWLTLSFCVGIAAFSTICAVFFASAIATPLDRMSDIVHTITHQGDVTRVGRLPQLQRDEVGELADATNAMIDRLEQSETRRAAINNSLEALNRTLEERVRERTDSLQRANQTLAEQRDELEHALETRRGAEERASAIRSQLVEMSRKAGAAEVASNVLHNVGNVLNSANMSSNLLLDTLRTHRVHGLSKLAELLKSVDDLPRFLAEDPRGRRIPDFVAQLGKALEEERAEMAEEMASLQKNLDHVKIIVALQQSHATAGGLIEEVQLAELLEDALSLSRMAFEKRGVAVVREYQELPPLSLDRHKILQIVLNLIGNAREALEESIGERRVTVRLRRDTEGWIAIDVVDTGYGIASENLVRIFNHGFTTKKGGHGFGLHSSACAAAAMGGTLSAHSDGAGRGAVFTLRLPVAGAASTVPAPDVPLERRRADAG
jgi:signal transduction histidine kinase